MSTALGLAMQISANTAQLAQAVQDVNAKLDAMGQAGVKASKDLGTLKNIEIGKLALGGIAAATNAFVGMSKAVLGAASSVVQFGKSVADELDSLNDVANRTGVGVEALQAYGAAAKLAGTDIGTFASALQKLTVNIGQSVGSEKEQEAFTKLGLVFDELRAKTPTEQFEAVADAISKIADPAERAAAAVSVFGKTGIELGPLFSEGPGALAKMREEAIALGQVVSGDSIKSIAAMNDAFDKVWMTVKGLTGQIVGELAEPVRAIAEDLLRVIKEAGATNIAQTVASGLLDFIELAGNAFFSLAQFIEAFVKKFAPLLGLDLRSDAQKELEELRRLQSRGSTGGFVNTGGGFGIGQQQARGPSLTAQQRARLEELEKQVAAETQGSVLNSMQRSFESAIDLAQSRIAERTQKPGEVDPRITQAIDSAIQNNEPLNYDKLLEELKGLRRDQSTSTVDILGAG